MSEEFFDFITVGQAAKELDVTIYRVHALIREGRLKAKKIAKVYVIRRGDLEAVRNRKPGRPRKKDVE